MTDFLLELRSEEIPARMQVKAKDDLARLFAEEIAKAGLLAANIETFATPRRLALIARGLPDATDAVREETKGPKASAPAQALEGFLRKTGLAREQLVERDGVLFAVVERAGRPTAEVLAAAVPAVVRAFPWPKSMRWGAAAVSTESLRWVRPLTGIVALFGRDVVPFAIDHIDSGAVTLGHRFHHPGPITIGSADDYVEKLRACHVVVDFIERCTLIREGARGAAAAAGLTLVEDEGLVVENAGLTEWPVPLLGRFDAAFLDVPREVIQLTMRTNQKYFACVDAGGALANAFVCTANIDAVDPAVVVAGNAKVLAARLSDAKFFWEADLKVPLAAQAEKLKDIVFHEKLGTVADKVERVAKLARWLCEEGIVKPLPFRGGVGVGAMPDNNVTGPADNPHPNPSPEGEGLSLADLAERAAHLCKADLVTGMVGEFPELQGIIGGHLARAQGEDPRVAAAIRDHYKPVGQGDDVPTDPVTVAVSLADKLDTLVGFFLRDEQPTGSRDPFALRRSSIGLISILQVNALRLNLSKAIQVGVEAIAPMIVAKISKASRRYNFERDLRGEIDPFPNATEYYEELMANLTKDVAPYSESASQETFVRLMTFLADRLKVQQREAGVRHDLIDAVFALGGEDDLVRLLARVKALQGFIGTADGANLLSGYKRAANILRKEDYKPLPFRGGVGVGPAHDGRASVPVETPHPNPSPEGGGLETSPSYTPESAETALTLALDTAEPLAAAAIEAEDFEGAMAALATLRAPIDAFFACVIVNDPDAQKRNARLALLARVRDAVHRVADFSKIEG